MEEEPAREKLDEAVIGRCSWPPAGVMARVQEGSSERSEVRQLQFVAWPDHGVPEHGTALLTFIRRFRALQPPDAAGPVVVHCRSVFLRLHRLRSGEGPGSLMN